MVLNILFNMLILMLFLYMMLGLMIDTTKFEYKVVTFINKIYNWFKNLFRNDR